MIAGAVFILNLLVLIIRIFDLHKYVNVCIGRTALPVCMSVCLFVSFPSLYIYKCPCIAMYFLVCACDLLVMPTTVHSS